MMGIAMVWLEALRRFDWYFTAASENEAVA
jgi:hypothetical protein